MGNYNFRTQLHPPGSRVVITHDEYSKYQEIPDNVLRTGQEAQVLKSVNMFQSRKEAPMITVSKVKFRDGYVDTYISTNLKKR